MSHLPPQLQMYFTDAPMPDKPTSCGLPPPLSLIDKSAPRDPVAAGLKVTVIVHDPPPATLVAQLLV